ncbi:MAG: DoxX family protein [Pyrinomonadaceae bacterium]
MNILLWIVQILLALLFIFSGVMKFVIPYADMIKDAPVVFPHTVFLFIGICEILGGLGLVLPWATKIKPGLTPLAAGLLVIIMIGATVVTALSIPPAMAFIPAIVGLLCGFIAWGRTGASAG